MMKLLALPPSLILLALSYLAECEGAGHGNAPPPLRQKRNVTQPTATTGSGSDSAYNITSGSGAAYATACAKLHNEYNAAESSWDAIHNSLDITTRPLGGQSFARVTYYENATTLCDGHPRVTYSPAKSLSEVWETLTAPITGYTTVTQTYGRVFSSPTPVCSINPKDCDGLWSDYSKSVAAAATITSAPPIPTPFCANQSAIAAYSSATADLYGCGACTIYGFGVELVYFPPKNTSRDFCATTPTATLTSYGPGAVITAYAGKSFGANSSALATTNGPRTAVVGGHTFTTGTAYISISTVYAVDRCSSTFGPVVTDAILAMPPESVLSLRYSQDKYQRLQTTDTIKGYPVDYADFQQPIPYSAWIGQNICNYPGDDVNCGVIYENDFKPQLAIPPEITSLSPDFKNCQLWYNGLWDPPLALTEVDSAAGPTLPGGHQSPQSTATAQPSQAPALPPSPPTAVPNALPSSAGHANPGYGGPTLPHVAGPTPTGYEPGAPNGNQPAASGVPAGVPSSGGNGNNGGSPNQGAGGNGNGGSGSNGNSGSSPNQGAGGNGNSGGSSNQGAGGNGNSGTGSTGSTGSNGGSSNQGTGSNGNSGGSANQGTGQGSSGTQYVPSGEPWTTEVSIGGNQYPAKGDDTHAVIGTHTILANGPAQTLADGTVFSYGDAGLTYHVLTTVVFDAPAGATGTPGLNDAGGNDLGVNPTRTGDIDIATMTINGEVETIVQQQDGGPVVINGIHTLVPGGEPLTYSNGEYISIAKDGSGIVVAYNGTLGAKPTSTGGDGSVSGAIRSGLGYGSNDASTTSESTSATETGAASASPTSSASALVSFEAFNVVAVILTLMIAVAA